LPLLYQSDLAMQPWAELSTVCMGGMVASHGVAPYSAFPEKFHHVRPDFFANMEQACIALRARGYRRIGVFMSQWHNLSTGRQYEAAFRMQMNEWPKKDRVPMLITPESSSEAEQRVMLGDWVRNEKPDVVLTGQGYACDALKKEGLRIPKDVGLAHIWLSDDTPDWSGIDPDLEAVGAAAVDQLVAQLQANTRGQPAKVHRLSFLGRWVDGWTTK